VQPASEACANSAHGLAGTAPGTRIAAPDNAVVMPSPSAVNEAVSPPGQATPAATPSAATTQATKAGSPADEASHTGMPPRQLHGRSAAQAANPADPSSAEADPKSRSSQREADVLRHNNWITSRHPSGAGGGPPNEEDGGAPSLAIVAPSSAGRRTFNAFFEATKTRVGRAARRPTAVGT
jgi:hypothetical protein